MNQKKVKIQIKKGLFYLKSPKTHISHLPFQFNFEFAKISLVRNWKLFLTVSDALVIFRVSSFLEITEHQQQFEASWKKCEF